MNRNTCPRCEQPLAKKRIDYLRRLRSAVATYHVSRFRDLLGNLEPSLEITIRIDGEVVDVVSPEAFDAFCSGQRF